jgi:predicted transposase/invertase (TIGR01784 family)
MTRKLVHTPHDRFFRASLDDPRVAREFLEVHLPEEIKILVDFNTLEMCHGTFVDEVLQLNLTDVLFSLKCLGDEPGYLYALLEHLRNPDPLMPFKKLRYTVKIMEQHYKKHKILPIVYTLVLYNGETKYPHSTDLFDLFGAYKNLAQKTFLQPFDLVDLSQIPDATLKEHLWSGMMELSLKHISEPNLILFIENELEWMQKIEQKGGTDYLNAVFCYFFIAGNIPNMHTLRGLIHNNFSQTWEENIMTLAELCKQEGRQEGRQEVTQEFALWLLKKNTPENEISAATGLSLAAIQALRLQETVH